MKDSSLIQVDANKQIKVKEVIKRLFIKLDSVSRRANSRLVYDVTIYIKTWAQLHLFKVIGDFYIHVVHKLHVGVIVVMLFCSKLLLLLFIRDYFHF